MFPTIIPEQLIHEFKFWDAGKVHRGMRSNTNLYRCIMSFPLTQSQQAYSLGTTLCEQSQSAVLTKSKHGYTVWLSLRSDAFRLEADTTLPSLMPVGAM